MFANLPPSVHLDLHKQAVDTISERVSRFYETKVPFRIYHGSTNATRPSLRQFDRMVDTSTLNHVLHVDTGTKVAIVEPNVPMDLLLDETIKHGLCPKVVMEFPGITAGGAFAGIGGESSSFKHGYFDATVRQVEIVLGDGSITVASSDPQSKTHDLFKGSAGTMGTLGVVTCLEVELVEAGQWVDLTYHSVYSSKSAVAKVTDLVRLDAGNDFVDGIMLGTCKGVVMSGRFASPNATKPSYPVARFARARDNWFYLHAGDQFKAKMPEDKGSDETITLSIPIRDYLFRYDRGAFWMGRHAFKYFSFTPFDRISRFFLDPFLHTRTMYRAMHYAGHYDWYLIQDLGLPVDQASQFIDYVDEQLDIWPLWLCPLRCGWGTKWLRPNPSTGKARFAYPALNTSDPDVQGSDQRPWESADEREMVFNIGCWGTVPGSSPYHAPSAKSLIDSNRAIEAKVSELGGVKWPYSQYFYTEDEFWQIYDREAYEAVRKKYKAETLPSMWDKIRPHLEQSIQETSKDNDEVSESRQNETRVGGPPNGSRGIHGWILRKLWHIWPVSGLYAIVKVIVSRKYLLQRESP